MIVGAGDNSGTIFSREKDEYIIAADGGITALERIGITPDLVIGDFDSLGYVPKGDNVIVHKVEKDDTDMMLSVEKAIESGYNDITIYGGTGGRVDHTFANLQTMLFASRKGVFIKMIDSENIYQVITNQSLTLNKKDRGNVSVFAIGGEAKGVNIIGGKYEAKDIHLTPDNPTAVSNSFVGKDICISVKEGSLLIIKER